MEMSLKIGQKVRGRRVAVLILSIAIVLILLLSFNWTTWAGEGEQQKTDDAYVRADVTPLSTKAAGIFRLSGSQGGRPSRTTAGRRFSGAAVCQQKLAWRALGD
jgi:hypothetical protein